MLYGSRERLCLHGPRSQRLSLSDESTNRLQIRTRTRPKSYGNQTITYGPIGFARLVNLGPHSSAALNGACICSFFIYILEKLNNSKITRKIK